MEALLELISREDRTTFKFLAPMLSLQISVCLYTMQKGSITKMTGVNFAGLK